MYNLGDYLTGGQMTHEAHLACCAEDTAHGAAGLGADASSSATFKGHENCFDGLIVVQLQ